MKPLVNLTRSLPKYLCLVIGGGVVSLLYGQNVGIGTAAPDASAKLDIVDPNRGLLVPRVALTATNAAGPVTSPANGLLVFNTATAGTAPNNVTPGFYYWDGVANRWVRLETDAWRLAGNAGTNPSINFLGTVDNQPLVLRTNNIQRLQINTNYSIQRDAGGDPRGTGAVDLQYVRTQPTQVASGLYALLAGGEYNTASGRDAAVIGAYSSLARGVRSFVAGGLRDTVDGQNSFVIGGRDNYATAPNSGIIGGRNNRAVPLYPNANFYPAIVIGGSENIARAEGIIVNGHRCSITGGMQGIYSGIDCKIGDGVYGGGGLSTIVGSGSSTIGENGMPSGQGIWTDGNIILGGGGHRINPFYGDEGGFGAIVGGGLDTLRNASYSFIAGSTNSRLEGQKSALIGCRLCYVNGFYVYAFGRGVRPPSNNSFRMYIFGDDTNIPGATFGNNDEGTPGQPIPASSGRVAINRLAEPLYPLHIGTNSNNGNGAHVTVGGVWTNGSSISFKDRFVELDKMDILSRIRRLTLMGWYYKGTEEYHIGPFAEEFRQLFGTGVDFRTDPEANRYISTIDPSGVALVGIQALADKVDELTRKIHSLEEEIANLRQLVKALTEEKEALSFSQKNHSP